MLFCCFNKVGVGWAFDASFDSFWKKREMYLHTIAGKVPGPQHESRQWHPALLTVIIFLTAMYTKQEKKSQPHLRMTLCSKSLQSCPTLCDPMDCNPPAPLSMGFSKQEYWRGLPFPPPGDLPNPRIEPRSPALQADSLPTKLRGKSSENDGNTLKNTKAA